MYSQILASVLFIFLNGRFHRRQNELVFFGLLFAWITVPATETSTLIFVICVGLRLWGIEPTNLKGLCDLDYPASFYLH
jgi:hypothetical protein